MEARTNKRLNGKRSCSLEPSIHQLLCHTASATVTGRNQSFNDACGDDFPSESAPHCTGSDLRERHFYIGSDVEDGGGCSVTTCKDPFLEFVNARSIVMCLFLASCFVTKPHKWHHHRKHFGQTFAVPGALTPRSTASESYSGDEYSGEEEALPYRCDGCLGPLSVLPLRGPTECSMRDELCTDLTWCEWCRTLICPDCVRIMARIAACNFSDYSELSDGDSAASCGSGRPDRSMRLEGVSLTGRSTRTKRNR